MDLVLLMSKCQVILYQLLGCSLWNLTNKEVHRFYATWRKCIHKLGCLPYRTHCRFLPVLYDGMSIDLQLMHRYASFMLNIYKSNNYIITLCRGLCQHSKTSAAVNRRMLLHMLNVNSNNIETPDNWCDYKNKLKHTYHVSDDININVNLIIELCMIRDGLLTTELSMVEINDILNDITL